MLKCVLTIDSVHYIYDIGQTTGDEEMNSSSNLENHCSVFVHYKVVKHNQLQELDKSKFFSWIPGTSPLMLRVSQSAKQTYLSHMSHHFSFFSS